MHTLKIKIAKNLLPRARNFVSRYFTMRTFLLAAVYSILVFASLTGAYLLRFDFDLSIMEKFPVLLALCVMLPVKLSMLAVFGQFKSLLYSFYLPDLLNIFFAMTLSGVAVFGVVSSAFAVFGFEHTIIPRGALVSDYMISMILFSSFRFSVRLLRERLLGDRINPVNATKRVMIFGAGDIGMSFAGNLMSRKGLGVKPVVFIDDDPKKYGKELLGLEVLNASGNLEEVVKAYKVDKVIVASSRISGSRIAAVMNQMKNLSVDSCIVPSYYDFASGHVKISEMREIGIEDILGRNSVQLDSKFIDDMIKDKVVMVTGAGGSIGSELCRQIASKSPKLLVLVDHCEVQMFQIEQNLISMEFGIRMKCCIGSVTDENRMEEIVKNFKPDIIFHAAAHKHVPMMESQPGESLKNNSLGTWIMGDVASRNGVGKFLLISTDKAINPTNVMGASKRLAEKAVLSIQSRPDNRTSFVVVRFGNVLGSSGSVIPTFRRQIAEGGPVTVTHPEVTRYFMTIPEAIGLVLQCAAQAIGGEILVLNMGKPIKIMDLARQMIRLSGFEPDVDIQIKTIGLRPGEKLYEELQYTDEHLVKTGHPKIFGYMSDTPPPSYEKMKSIANEIRTISDSKSVNDLKNYILNLVPEYRPQFYD